MILEIDDETANVLNTLAEQEHTPPAQVLKHVLLEYLEDWQDARRGEEAYRRHIDSGKAAHDLKDVVQELGLDS